LCDILKCVYSHHGSLRGRVHPNDPDGYTACQPFAGDREVVSLLDGKCGREDCVLASHTHYAVNNKSGSKFNVFNRHNMSHGNKANQSNLLRATNVVL
jgi:hypothetical protein